MQNDRQRYRAVQDAPTSRHMAGSTTRTYVWKISSKTASMHKGIHEDSNTTASETAAKASRQTHRRQDATACTQQHMLQSGKPTPDRYPITQQRANTLPNSMLTTRSACRVSLHIKTTHTQHAHSGHKDSNTKTASQTTSNHAASQTD